MTAEPHPWSIPYDQMTAHDLTMRLYDTATDYEASVLDELRDRAGIGDEDCEDCGLTKAEAVLAADMLEDCDE